MKTTNPCKNCLVFCLCKLRLEKSKAGSVWTFFKDTIKCNEAFSYVKYNIGNINEMRKLFGLPGLNEL